MAQSTIDEDITRLEAELATVRTQISEIQQYKEIEESGSRGGNRTRFTEIDKLRTIEKDLQTQLDTLYRYGSYAW